MEQKSKNDHAPSFKKTRNGHGGKGKNFGKRSGDRWSSNGFDPYRKGLNGAASKWYNRYIKEGYSPQEARQMAEERNTRRENSYSRHNDNQYSQGGRIDVNEPYEGEVATKNHIRKFPASNSNSIAILPANYPTQILTSEQLASLEEAILSEVAKGHETPLAFEGLHFHSGFVVVDCKDASTASWLKGVTPKLKNWCGMEIRACQKEDIPKMFSISLCLPKSNGQTVERSLSLLKAQNTGINTAIWRIISCKDEEMGQRMNVDIDEGSRKAIEENGNTLNYRFGKVLVNELNSEASEHERNHLYRESSRENLRSVNDACSEAGSSVHNTSIRVKGEEYLMN